MDPSNENSRPGRKPLLDDSNRRENVRGPHARRGARSKKGVVQKAKLGRRKREILRTKSAAADSRDHFAFGRARTNAAHYWAKKPHNHREKRPFCFAAPRGRGAAGDHRRAKSSLVWREDAKSFEKIAPPFGTMAQKTVKTRFCARYDEILATPA